MYAFQRCIDYIDITVGIQSEYTERKCVKKAFNFMGFAPGPLAIVRPPLLNPGSTPAGL